MGFIEDMEYSAPYYKWVYTRDHVRLEAYDKFVNWVSGEYDLYLQEAHNGLKVYYPNGWLQVTNPSKEPDKASLQITIHNKSKKEGEQFSSELQLIYNQVKSITGITQQVI